MRSGLFVAITIGVVVAISSGAFAQDCVDSKGKDISSQPELFQKEIAAKETCHEAAELARACSWGSSLDVRTVEIAANICMIEIKAEKPSAKDLALLKTMRSRCTEKYEKEEGTMYRSFEAYCHLGAIEWILGIVTR